MMIPAVLLGLVVAAAVVYFAVLKESPEAASGDDGPIRLTRD